MYTPPTLLATSYLDLAVCVDGSNVVPLLISGGAGEQGMVSDGYLTESGVWTKTGLTQVERQPLKLSRNTETVFFSKERAG